MPENDEIAIELVTRLSDVVLSNHRMFDLNTKYLKS
jgi:hypothetical protein